MTPSIETSIWLALKSRVDTIPLTFARAWPSKPFTHPAVNGKMLPFLRVGRINATPLRQMIAPGQAHERNGLLMVTVVYPIGQDVSVYDETAGVIAQHFKDGTQVQYGSVCVSVPSYPHVVEGYEDNAYWNTPVRIPWRCYA